MDFFFSSSSRWSSANLSAHALSLATAAIFRSTLMISFFFFASWIWAFRFLFSAIIKARRNLIRFFSFLLFTLPSFGWLGRIGSPGVYWTQAYGPGGLKLALLRRGLSLGRLFGNRVSVKLWRKWFAIGNQGASVLTEPAEGRWKPGLAEVKGDGNGVRELEGRDLEILVRGRTMDLRIPSPISATQTSISEQIGSFLNPWISRFSNQF